MKNQLYLLYIQPDSLQFVDLLPVSLQTVSCKLSGRLSEDWETEHGVQFLILLIDESETKSDKNWNSSDGVSLQDNIRFNKKSKQFEIEIYFKHSAAQSNLNSSK